MKKSFRAIATGLLVALSSSTLFGQSADNEKSREDTIRFAATVTGAAGGFSVAAVMFGFYGFAARGTDALFSPEATVGQRLAVVIPATLVMTATSTLAIRVFGNFFLRNRMSPLLSVPVGALAGAAAGACIGAASWLTTFVIGYPTGIISSGVPSLLGNLGLSFLAGAFWGAVAGVVPGSIGGPVISLALKS